MPVRRRLPPCGLPRPMRSQLGAMRMQRLSEQGEQLARSGDLMIVGFLVQDLEDELVRVREWLTGYATGGVE